MKNILSTLLTTLWFISNSSAQNPYPIVPIDSVQFVNQIKLTATPVVDLPDYISPTFVNTTYRDTVRFDGVVVTSPKIYGLSTLRKAAYIQRHGGGPWSGVLVMCDPMSTPATGRPTLDDFITETKFYENMMRGAKVRVTGKFAAFQSETQINLLRNNTNFSNAIEKVDSNNYQPIYTVIAVDSLMTGNPTAGGWTQNKAQGEKWEGVLVEIRNVRVSTRTPLGSTRWSWSLQDTFGNQIDVRDFSAYYRNDNNESIIPSIPNNYTPPPVGTTLGYIRGIVGEYMVGGVTRYGILPITPDDISTCDTACFGLSINTNRCAFVDEPMVFNISQYGNFLADTGIFEFSADSFFNNIIKYDTFSTFNSFSHSYSNNINLNSGNYFVRLRVKNQNLLSNVMEFYMNSNKIFASDTIIRFNNNSVLLDAGQGFTSYLWNSGDTTQTFLSRHGAKYNVTVKNQYGCSNSDSIQVILIQGIQQNDTTICSSDSLKLTIYESSNLPVNGLVAWYPFNGNSNDQSGNGNDLFGNAILDKSRNDILNSSFRFNGTNYLFCKPKDLAGRRDKTISVWLKYNSGSINNILNELDLVHFGGGNNPSFKYSINYGNDNLKLFNACFSNINSNMNLKNGWMHLVISDSVNLTKVYINGILTSVHNSSDTLLCYFGDSSLYLGGGIEWRETSVNLDDISIWKRPLISKEVQDLYSSSVINPKLKWSTNDTTNSITVSPTSSTTYYCDITVGSYTFRDSVRVNVRELPNKSINYAKLGLCKNDTITLNAASGYNYSWLKNDTIVGQVQALNVSQAGAYHVALIDSFGCRNTSDTIHVFNAPLPQANLLINDTAQCLKENMFVFKDSTLLDSGTYNRVWSFGTGNTSTQIEPTYNYTNTGSFSVKLSVTTNYGCKDSVVKVVTVNTNPTAGPMLGETNALAVATPYVYTVAQQPNHTYNWIVTNGIIASGQGTNAATVQWLANGKGSLKVEITNTQGCSDTTLTQVTVGNVGLYEAGNINSLMVYPNPSNGAFTVSLNAIKSSTIQMSLINLLGQEIWSDDVMIKSGEQNISVQANLSPGMYTLRLAGQDDQIQQKVIIK